MPERVSLRSRAMRGTLFSLMNVGGAQLLRLAGNLVTTRLLFPEAFGLLFMVVVLNQGLQMISDVGILPSIIQHERGEERKFLDTAWTIQAARGVVITLLTLMLAWPWAQFCGEAELLPLMLVASLQATITGLDSTKLALLNRRMQVGRLVTISLVQQLVTQVTMITAALLTRSVWSLLVGALAGEVVRMVLSHVAVPGPRNRFAWDREAGHALFHFGKWIFVSTLVTFIGLRFDAFVLPRVVDNAVLGVYSVGQSLASLPVLITGQIIIWVLLPGLSEVFREDPARFAERVRRARRIINAAGVLMIAGTAALAPAFFFLLYDARYHDAGWMVQLLMLSTWFFFLQETALRIQLATGDSRISMTSNVVKIAATAPAAIGGYLLLGLTGLILGLGVGALAGYLVVAWSLRGRGVALFHPDARWTALALALGLTSALGPWLLAPYVGVRAELLSLAFAALVVGPYGLWAARLVVGSLRGEREERASVPTTPSPMPAKVAARG